MSETKVYGKSVVCLEGEYTLQELRELISNIEKLNKEAKKQTKKLFKDTEE